MAAAKVVPIWVGRRDVLATAEAAHRELHNAERGVPVRCACGASSVDTPLDFEDVCRVCRARETAIRARRERVAGFLFARSRERRARALDALAVALLFLLMAVFGAALFFLSAPQAKADITDPVSVAYAAHWAGAVCGTLADHPTTNGVLGIIDAIEDQGLTTLQAAQVVTLSVSEACPYYQPILDAFIDRHHRTTAVTA